MCDNRATRSRAYAVVLLVGLAACAAGARPGAPPDARARDELYARSTRPFSRAFLLRPNEDAAAEPGFDLAPLLLHELGLGSHAPEDPLVVRVLRSTLARAGGAPLEQWTYLWSYPASPAVRGERHQGLRLTLASDGFPAIYEVLDDSSGARPIFVAATLEAAAAAAFGPPCPGRRFAVERPLEAAPLVVVPALLEPGPVPLGPFVYLTHPARDVSTLLCRCAPSLVERVTESAAYRLERLPSREALAPPVRAWLERDRPALERALRLPPDAL